MFTKQHYLQGRGQGGLRRGVACVRGGHGDGMLPRAVRKIAGRDYCFVMSVCIEQLGFHWTDAREIEYTGIFRISLETKISSFIKIR